jgi:predicted transcriptional regulator of viral defense system
MSNPDLVTVAVSVPKAVICLISALSFHRLTTQIPHKVYIALPELTRSPRQDYPPLAIHRFRGKAFDEGIENHLIDGVNVKIYSPEKTLADCFKFRNKIGMDVVLEALKFYRSQKKFDIKAIMKYAKICRVEKQMRPYLEAMA